jgi:uncharacterized caspase-like protein
MIRTLLAIALAVTFAAWQPARAQAPAPRIALIIGNSAYQGAGPIPTAAADATIVAETMRTAGYDVTELHDVTIADFGQAIRAFLDKVYSAGPETVAFLYFGGYGAQFDGENYLIPVDARIPRYADVPSQAFRLNDLIRELAELPAAARLLVLDASRDPGFGRGTSEAVPPGLAITDAPAGMLIAFAAAPGAVSGEIEGPYSLYTGTLVTLMRQPGLDIEQIFKATRLEVNRVSTAAQTPWTSSTLAVGLTLFEAPLAAAPDAVPPPPVSVPPLGRSLASRDELRQLAADEAYARVVEMDNLQNYQWFVDVFPTYRLTPQIWVIIETRREAILWRRSVTLNSQRAYWNYLKRYPNGAHAAEARFRLGMLSAPLDPPLSYVAQPEPMPPGWWDEAVNVVEVVPQGYDAPPAVFDVLPPVYVVPPPPLFPPPIGFYAPPSYWLVPRAPPPGVVVVAPVRLGPVALIRLPPRVTVLPLLVARPAFLVGGRPPPLPPPLRPLPAFARPPLLGVSLPAPPPGRPPPVPLSTTRPLIAPRPGVTLPPSTRPIGPTPALGVAKPAPTTPSPGLGGAKAVPLTGAGTGAAKTPSGPAKEFKKAKGPTPGAGVAKTTSPSLGAGAAKQASPSGAAKQVSPSGAAAAKASSPPPRAVTRAASPPPRPPPPAARPPPRPAAAAAKPAPRRPVCRTVNGKQVCS